VLLFDRIHDGRHRRHYRPHLRSWRDDWANGRGVESRTCETLREALQLRVFGVESEHALLQLGDLSQLAELRFVVVEEEEERFGPGNVLWFGSNFSNNGLEDSACIYDC
jgi:hypothetical protein